MSSLTIYLSIPICYCNEGCTIEKGLEKHGYQVLNPCRIIPPNCPREQLPRRISQECYSMIDKADALVLFADYYGRDCAAEVGYAIARKKPVLPIILRKHISENLAVDWMITAWLHPPSRSLDELRSRIASLEAKCFSERVRSVTSLS